MSNKVISLYGSLGDRLKSEAKPEMAVGYAESLSKELASSKAHMAGGFTVYMQLGEKKVQEFAESCMKPLQTTFIDAKKGFDAMAKDVGASRHAKVLAGLKYEQAARDVAFMESNFNQTTSILHLEALNNQLQVQEQVLLPLQYINYLQSTARHVVPAEVTDKEIFVRRRWIKEASVRGSDKKYRFPEALENKEYLDAVLNADGASKVVVLNTTTNPSTASVDLVGLMGNGYVSGKDKIEPVIKIKKIKVAGMSAAVSLPDNLNTTIDLQKKGDSVLFTQVVDKTTNPATVHDVKMSFQVDFEECKMEYTATANVAEIHLEMVIKSGTFGRGITVKEFKEEFHYNITRHIQGSFNWNYREVAQKMNFENTDMVVTAAEMMSEIFDAAKDHYQFSELDKTYDELVALNTLGMLSKDDFVAKVKIDLNVDPTKVAVVTDNPGALRNTFINDAMTKLMLEVKTKYKPKAGWSTNMWTNLEIARILAPDHTVIGAGDEYGGVTSLVSVRGGDIGGYVYKLVETQRESLESTEIKMIPFFNDGNIETFKFLQWEIKRMDDNSYRDPAAPNQPSFHVVDHFQMVGINKAVYKLDIINKDKLMGDAQFVVRSNGTVTP